MYCTSSFAVVSKDWVIHNNSTTITFKRIENGYIATKSLSGEPFIGSVTATDATTTRLFKGKLILSNSSYLIIDKTSITYYAITGKILAKCNYQGTHCNNGKNLISTGPGEFDFTP